REKVTVHSKSITCADVELRGEVTIGQGTVVHPKVVIFGHTGPVVIGNNCIIEEGTVIINRRKEVMRIGDNNLFEIGCRVESPSIGDWNTIGVRARVHHTLRISSHCVIGAGCVVAPVEDEVLGEYTVIYGPTAERRTWSGRGRVQEDDLRRKHWEYLKEMIPKFNRM
ncbi:trimeric LpxA-like protein, partial [Thelephora ganbajun]